MQCLTSFFLFFLTRSRWTIQEPGTEYSEPQCAKNTLHYYLVVGPLHRSFGQLSNLSATPPTTAARTRDNYWRLFGGHTLSASCVDFSQASCKHRALLVSCRDKTTFLTPYVSQQVMIGTWQNNVAKTFQQGWLSFGVDDLDHCG